MAKQPNQTPGAKRRVRNLAKATDVPAEVVQALCDLFWDFDLGPTNEPIGWIRLDLSSDVAGGRLRALADRLGLERDASVTRERAVEGIVKAHAACDPRQLWDDLERAGATRNTALLSRFASWHYLRGLDRELLACLDWQQGERDLRAIAFALFAKIFRAGSVDRHRLFYLYCDLAVPLTAPSRSRAPVPWVRRLLEAIASLPAESKLTDLLGCTKGLVKGGKHFKQSILEALAYAGALRIRGLDVGSMFLPQHRDATSAHFYSNEWAFPLRLWTDRGGEVDLAVLPNGGTS